jgi:hypothetical protein
MRMGLLTKILIIALLLIAGWYAYGHLKIDTVTVCVEKDAETLSVTCVDDADCVKYLTSLYGAYPDTPMYRLLVDASSTCDAGYCQMRDFEFKDVCTEAEFPVVYRVTAKELVSTK